MHIIKVSDYKNNSGLFSLGLAVKLAIGNNSDIETKHIPWFVKRILVSDVADTSNPGASQKDLGELLRSSLTVALNDDANFKENALNRFKQYCLNFDAVIPYGMDNFIKANFKTIDSLKVILKKLHSYQYMVNRFTEPSISMQNIDNFKEKLINIMNDSFFDEVLVHSMLNKNNDIKNVTDLFKICKMFSIAWESIKQNTETINKASTLNAMEDWFLLRANELIDLEPNQENRYKICILLALCKTFIGNFPDIMNNAKVIVMTRCIENFKDSIYDCYFRYMANGSEMIFAEELSCLASAWNVSLIINDASNFSDNNVLNRLTVQLINDTEDSWGVIADDSLLEPVSQIEDDKFKTLMILRMSLGKIIGNNPLLLDPSKIHKTIREFYITRRTLTGQLLIRPKDRDNSADTNRPIENSRVENAEALVTEVNSILWSFEQRKFARTIHSRTSLGISLSTGFIIESSAAIAGLYGAEEGFLLGRAIQTGRMARTGLEALNIGATLTRTLASPYALGPFIIIETYMLNRRKINEFNDAFYNAFVIYKEALIECNKEKLIFADATLRAEIGQGVSPRWAPTRLSIWAQSSYDDLAMLYYILGDIAKRTNKEDAQKLFEKAYYYAKDQNIKWLSLFGVAVQQMCELQKKLITTEKAKLELEKVVEGNIAKLQKTNATMIDHVFNSVLDTLSYVWWVVGFQKAEDALANIEEILVNKDIEVIKNLKPHGKFCEIAFIFIEAVCLDLRMTLNKKDLFAVDSEQSSRDYAKMIYKFKVCLTLMLKAETDIVQGDDNITNLVFIKEIRGYIKRFLENLADYEKNQESIKQLMKELNVVDGSSSSGDVDRELTRDVLDKRRNRRPNTLG